LKTKAELPSLPEERGDGGVRSVQVALDVLEGGLEGVEQIVEMVELHLLDHHLSGGQLQGVGPSPHLVGPLAM